MDSLEERFQKAFSSDNYSEIQVIVSELNAIAPAKKHFQRELYQSIGDALFDKSIAVANYDLAAYDLSIEEANSKHYSADKVAKVPTIFQDNIQEILLQFCKNSQATIPKLKSHFIMTLQNGYDSKASLLILASDNCVNHPLVQRLMQENEGLFPVKQKLSEFVENCKSETYRNNRYLCVVVIVPNLNYEEYEEKLLKQLFESYRESLSISLKKCDNVTAEDYSETKVSAEYLDEIRNNCGKVFNNRDITFEEEKIIKRFFPENSSVIDYKLLKGGFSGAKVAEVQPNKTMPGQTARFVIKYGKKDRERKIKKESESFEKFISEFTIPGYQSKYLETSQYEAIRYTYASSDNRKISFQFANLIHRFLTGKTIPFDLDKIVIQLFECEPFRIWGISPETKKETVKKLYRPYLDTVKILDSIARIRNISVEEVKNSVLWTDYEKIIDHVIEIKTKVCHGDLHTENLFKDEDGVFLIDFGYTETAHAVLDHSTLEASIRFKHIPFYVDIDDLKKYDAQLLSIKSFEPGFKLDFIDRPNLQDLYKLILLIRQDAKRLLKQSDHPLEYFISLFIITMRQIQYPDLNQKYALETASVLSKYIMSQLMQS